MEIQTILKDGLAALGLSTDCVEKLERYGTALVEKNKVMNLTAITDPAGVAQKHMLDCAAVLGAAEFDKKRVIDVGTGAGFPGLVLKICDGSIDLTLLDSLKKRMDWLESTLPELGIEAQCVAARAEEYALVHREQYDIAVSRAVARLTMLAELCLPLVRVGGHFVAMKSADSDEELSQAARAIATLGGKVTRIWDYPVPGTDAVHRAVVITKVKATPKPYPRRFAKIKQQPL